MSSRRYAKEDALRRYQDRLRRGMCRWCGIVGPFGSVGERERHENDACALSPLRQVESRRRVA